MTLKQENTIYSVIFIYENLHFVFPKYLITSARFENFHNI